MMKIYSLIVCSTLLLAVMTIVNATTEPVCAYTNPNGGTIFLKYLPHLKQGQDYVDFGPDGLCSRSAVCSETYETLIDDCSNYQITCANKDSYNGVFPACCIKC